MSNTNRLNKSTEALMDYLIGTEMNSSFIEFGGDQDEPNFANEYVAWLLPDDGENPHIYGDLLIIKHSGDIDAARAEAFGDCGS